MNKYILFALVFSSLSLYAQDDLTVDVTEETIEASPTSPLGVSEVEEKSNVDEEIAEKTISPVEKQVAEKEIESEFTPIEEPVVVSGPQTTAHPLSKIETNLEEHHHFNPRKSHWVANFGFESSRYEVVPKAYEFSGRRNFKNSKVDLYGGRIGFGGEIYLGAGFITRSLVEGYYLGNLFSQVLNGGSTATDVEFAYTKKTNQLIGFDASQSLGWMFDFKTKNPFMDEWSYLTVEMFAEAGLGKGWAFNRINYKYDTGTTPTAAQESYRLRMRDDLVNARVGGGFLMTSQSGFFLTVKATMNRYDVTQRKLDGFTQPNGSGTTAINVTSKNVNIDPVMIYTLGGGYKF